MIGAKMIADGAMGHMDRSVWYEGSIIGTDKLANSILGNALRAMYDDVTLDITVEGVGPTRIELTPGISEAEVGHEFAKLRLGANVLGLVANALRSHIISGGNGVLVIVIDL